MMSSSQINLFTNALVLIDNVCGAIDMGQEETARMLALILVREHHKQLREALQAQIDGGWQPIETAPKDGTAILGTSNKVLGSVPITCHWHSEWNEWVFSMAFGEPIRGGCTYVTKPTHWQPLPTPPKEDAARTSSLAD